MMDSSEENGGISLHVTASWPSPPHRRATVTLVKTRETTLKVCIKFVLRAMIHAYLGLYHCGTCHNKSCSPGVTVHETAWRDIKEAVEGEWGRMDMGSAWTHSAS